MGLYLCFWSQINIDSLFVFQYQITNTNKVPVNNWLISGDENKTDSIPDVLVSSGFSSEDSVSPFREHLRETIDFPDRVLKTFANPS
jgi:hypothetical protein